MNPYHDGYGAGVRGEAEELNPHVTGGRSWRDWRAGHRAGIRAKTGRAPTVVQAGIAADLAASLRALVARADGIDGPSHDELVAAKDALGRAQAAGI